MGWAEEKKRGWTWLARLCRWLADWCEPPVVVVPPEPVVGPVLTQAQVLARALTQRAEVEMADKGGEWKRRVVYAQLIKACPGTPRRVLALNLEQALQEEASWQ